jgi:hypothetical protein
MMMIIHIVIHENLLANHDGLPRHHPLLVLRAEVIPAQDLSAMVALAVFAQ